MRNARCKARAPAASAIMEIIIGACRREKIPKRAKVVRETRTHERTSSVFMASVSADIVTCVTTEMAACAACYARASLTSRSRKPGEEPQYRMSKKRVNETLRGPIGFL